jgi:hypothetical protein
MKSLNTILNRHHITDVDDRAAFRALVNQKVMPTPRFRAKLRGAYAAALADVRRTLTLQLGFVFPTCYHN